MAENKTFSVKNGLDVNRTVVLDESRNLSNINTANVETLNVNNAVFTTLTLPSLDAAANTVRVSQNSAGTIEKAQLNFVNTSTIGVTVSNNGGTANIAFSANTDQENLAANTVAVYSEGTLRYANANLNFNNTSTVNVTVTQDAITKAANLEISVNATAIIAFAKGEKGQKGEIGNKGDMGDQGPQGVQGEKGQKGEQGVQGAVGSQGSQGVQGAIGTGLVISGTVNAYEDLPFIGIANGEIYLTSSTQELWVFNSLEGIWNLLGDLTGPQGFQGVQGVQGHQGVQGVQGVQGATGSGAQGAVGIRGASSWTPITTNITQSITDSNLYTKTSGGSSWNAEVYSKEGYTRGVFVSANVAQTNAYMIVGLNEDPQANPSFTSIDYGFYLDPTGNVSLFEGGSSVESSGEYGTNTVFTITYNSLNIQYYKDGELVRTIPRAVGNPLYLDTAFYTINSSMYITFGAMGEAAGAQGAQGEQGHQGRQGSVGAAGSTGAQGSQGLPGSQGEQGFQGPQGAQGFQGVQGAVGSQGAQGRQGEQGAQGFQGVQGAQGDAGVQGDIGVQGPQGAPGAQGAAGTQGSQGHQGFQGVQGSIGNQGVQGADNVSQILGKQTIWVPAVAMISSTTNGALFSSTETTTNKLMIATLNFDATTEEYTQFMIQMPKSWDEGAMNVQFVWSHDTTATNFGVVWGIEAVAFNDGDAFDTAFGTAVTVSDTGGSANAIYRSAEATGLTVAGSPAAEEYVVFRVKRIPSNVSDTMAVDARLHGIKLHYIIDAARDN